MPEQTTNELELQQRFDALRNQPASTDSVDALNQLSADARRQQYSRLGVQVTRLALALAQEIHYQKGEAEAYINYGLYHYYAEDFENALVNNLKALKAAEGSGNEITVERCLNNIGSVYDASRHYDKARAYYVRAMEISRRLNRHDKLAITSNNVGSIYMTEGDYDKALEHFEESLNLFIRSEWFSRLGYCYSNMGEIYFRKGETKKAIEWFEKGLVNAAEHDNEKVKRWIMQLKGKALMLAGQYEEAESNLLQVLAMVEEKNIKYSIGDACESLAELNEKMGRYETAYKYFDRFVLLQVAIYEERSRVRMAEMRNLYELEMKELELEIQRFRNEELFRKMQETEETYRKLKEAQKSLLDMEKQNTILDMSVTANHELNQPLMIINGNLDLLEMDMKHIDTEAHEIIHEMHDSISVIRDILRGIHQNIPEEPETESLKLL